MAKINASENIYKLNQTGDDIQKILDSSVDGEYIKNVLTTHQSARILDHPDFSVTSDKIANGSINEKKLDAELIEKLEELSKNSGKLFTISEISSKKEYTDLKLDDGNILIIYNDTNITYNYDNKRVNLKSGDYVTLNFVSHEFNNGDIYVFQLSAQTYHIIINSMASQTHSTELILEPIIPLSVNLNCLKKQIVDVLPTKSTVFDFEDKKSLFIAQNRCSTNTGNDINSNYYYQTIQTASNAANQYAFSYLDLTDIINNSKSFSVDFRFRIHEGGRWYIGLSSSENRPGSSYRTSYDNTGVAFTCGTENGTNLYINSNITIANCIDNWIECHCDIDINNKTVSYLISANSEQFKDTVNFIDSNIEIINILEVYSYTNDTVLDLDNIKISLNEDYDDNTVYIVKNNNSVNSYIYVNGQPCLIGSNNVNSSDGFAAGESSKANTGAAVGAFAWANDGFAGGNGAYSDSGGAIGNLAEAENGGGAVGASAWAGAGFSGGNEAKVSYVNGAYIDAIQLGTGINSHEKTLQIYDYQLMNENGYVPIERIEDDSIIANKIGLGAISKECLADNIISIQHQAEPLIPSIKLVKLSEINDNGIFRRFPKVMCEELFVIINDYDNLSFLYVADDYGYNLSKKLINGMTYIAKLTKLPISGAEVENGNIEIIGALPLYPQTSYYSILPIQIGTWINGNPIFKIAFNHTFTDAEKQQISTNDYWQASSFLSSIDKSINDTNISILNYYMAARDTSPTASSDRPISYQGVLNFDVKATQIEDYSCDGVFGWIEYVIL